MSLNPYNLRKFPLAPMGVLAPVSAHAGHSAQPPIDTSGNFPARVSAESISPNFGIFRSKSAFLGGQGGSPKFFFHWNLHIFVTQEPMQKIKILRHPLLGQTAHFGFCPPKIGFFRGLGGSPKIVFHWKPNIFVTQKPMQNFKTVGQTLLGETAHFGFCPP